MIAKLERSQMQNYFDYVKRVTTIQNEAVRRLVNCEDTDPLELAELFEDIANRYLDISEKIRAHSISRGADVHSLLAPQEFSPSSETKLSEEVSED